MGHRDRASLRGLRYALAAADQGVDHLQGDRQPACRSESTVRCLGVDVEDALNLAEGTEV